MTVQMTAKSSFPITSPVWCGWLLLLSTKTRVLHFSVPAFVHSYFGTCHSYFCKPVVNVLKIANEGNEQLVGGKKHKNEMKIRWLQGTLPCTGHGIAQQIAEIFRDSWSPSSDGLNLSCKVLNCINSKHYNPLLPFAVLYLLKHVTTPGAEMSNAYNFQQTWLLDSGLQQ